MSLRRLLLMWVADGLHALGFRVAALAFDEKEYRKKAYCRARPAPLDGECQFDLASGQCLHCHRKVGEFGEPAATEKGP